MTTDMTRYYGGYGIAPCGHTKAGSADSDVEPRFLSSRPVDKQRNVTVSQVLRFFVYNYSSFTDIADIVVRVSEDGGGTFSLAFDSSGFASPYDGANSKIRRQDGHTLAIYLQKTSDWPVASKIVIEYEGADEYGNIATRTAPIRW